MSHRASHLLGAALLNVALADRARVALAKPLVNALGVEEVHARHRSDLLLRHVLAQTHQARGQPVPTARLVVLDLLQGQRSHRQLLHDRLRRMLSALHQLLKHEVHIVIALKSHLQPLPVTLLLFVLMDVHEQPHQHIFPRPHREL